MTSVPGTEILALHGAGPALGMGRLSGCTLVTTVERNHVVTEPGDQLPTATELAAVLTVAFGTAHRAIALHREECLIEVTRGRPAVT